MAGFANSPARPVCLVIMPMFAQFGAVRAAISRVMQAGRFEMCRLEQALPDCDWQHWLLQSLSRAQLVLADVTDNNPFVMYELGLVHERGLPSALIVDASRERVPATVLGLPFLAYDSDLNLFEQALAEVLSDMMATAKAASQAGAVNEIAGGSDSYERAVALAQAFGAASGLRVQPVSREEFRTRSVVAARRGGPIVTGAHSRHTARALLARIVTRSDETALMQAAERWLRARF